MGGGVASQVLTEGERLMIPHHAPRDFIPPEFVIVSQVFKFSKGAHIKGRFNFQVFEGVCQVFSDD